ncbi:hypothetical protein scyTo_0009555 [Scyliorhinus torazame]|uniref:Ig-like domain-containing protein n=1 Tax=Scyliorhinus torazame TaxID=75743 RepID=A0A401NP03_SCYTO|nr:hypothetical protein [Scyliorhinus torazame]
MSENKKKDRGKKKGDKRGKGKGKRKAAPPKLKKLKNQTLVEGQKLSLKCEAVGNPRPTYKWFKDGREIKKNKEIRIKTGKKNSRLQINKLKVEDAGEYTCEAENALGKDTSKTTINVQAGECKYSEALLIFLICGVDSVTI